jgi:hypothetical protein
MISLRMGDCVSLEFGGIKIDSRGITEIIKIAR